IFYFSRHHPSDRSLFPSTTLFRSNNVPLIDPATLLSTPEYLATGALFWPDRHNIEPERPIWDICRVPHRSEPEFETGQLVIDKEIGRASCRERVEKTRLLVQAADG